MTPAIQKIRISDASHINRAVMSLQGLKLGEKEYEFTLGLYELDRSSAQKGYYFRVVGIIANSLGWDKNDLHSWYKVNYLMPIFSADPKNEQYRARIEAINQAYAARSISEQMRDDLLAAVTSTNDAKMKHMRELINDVQGHAASLDVRLPIMDWQQ